MSRIQRQMTIHLALLIRIFSDRIMKLFLVSMSQSFWQMGHFVFCVSSSGEMLPVLVDTVECGCLMTPDMGITI